MLAAMRSPIQRSAAAANSEVSPSEGREPAVVPGAPAGAWAREKFPKATNTRTPSANRLKTRPRPWRRAQLRNESMGTKAITSAVPVSTRTVQKVYRPHHGAIASTGPALSFPPGGGPQRGVNLAHFCPETGF